MADEKTKVKGIIMDKAPSGSSITMGPILGYTPGDYPALADAINVEFGITIDPQNLQGLVTAEDVCNYVLSQIP